MTQALRVLGIDPGTATVGWAVVEQKEGKIIPIGYGAIETSKNNPNESRLLEIHRDIEQIIEKYNPNEAAIEDIFFFKNLKTAVKVSQARGVILLTITKKRVKLSEYTPLQVKQALTGYGRAEKKQIQLMVKNVLKLKEIPTPDDTADALAIAVCHINSRRLKNLK